MATDLAARFFRIRYLCYSFRKRVVPVAAIGLVFVFLALAQHSFVHRHIYRTVSEELASWAAQIADEISYKTKWDLTGYRRASVPAPSWFVVTEDGLIIDIEGFEGYEGFIPNLLGKVEPFDDSVYSSPKTIVTTTGETWRLFGRRVLGGWVVVGISSPENMENADAKLLENAAKFGTTLEEATSTSPREIDWVVDYAVVGSDGDLAYAIGGVPLKTAGHPLQHLSRGITPFVANGKPYLLYSEPLLDTDNHPVGTVIVPKDMSLAQQSLRIHDRFNYMVVGAAGFLIAVMVLQFVGRELLSRANRITLEEALKSGESLTVEFKSAFEFQWDAKQEKQNEERILPTLKSIAGFLNARGGTLFIGVAEDKGKTGSFTVCGVHEDLRLHQGSKDCLQRKLRDLITTRIGSKFSPFIEEYLEEAAGQLCWVVRVAPAPEPAFVRWKEQKKFYVREGAKTSDLDNESTWRYIRNRWR